MPKMMLGTAARQFDRDADRPLQQGRTEFGQEQGDANPAGTAAASQSRKDHVP